MPRRKSSVKKHRADKKRRLKNLRVKQQLKKIIKKFGAALSAKNSEEARTLLKNVFSQLDKAAKKKIIHPNAANRKKSRLTQRLTKNA